MKVLQVIINSLTEIDEKAILLSMSGMYDKTSKGWNYEHKR